MKVLKRSIKFFLKILQIPLFGLFYLLTFFTTKTGNRLAIGPVEAANNIWLLKQMFPEETIAINFKPHPFYQRNQYDYTLSGPLFLTQIAKTLYGPFVFAKLLRQCDVFFFLFIDGYFIDREIDYCLLRFFKKKIVCAFVGSDIRSIKLTREAAKRRGEDCFSFYSPVDPAREAERENIAYLAEKYADLIYSHPLDQPSYLKNSHKMFPYILSNDYFSFDKDKFLSGSIPRILHAPSNPVPKGTQLVRAAIKSLRLQGYEFEYIELIGVANEVVLEELRKSTIVLNQFYSLAPGLLGVEAMASANAVLMSADPACMEGIAGSAFLRTRYWEVEKNLKFLLDHPDKVEELAIAAYKYVNSAYSQEKIKLKLREELL